MNAPRFCPTCGQGLPGPVAQCPRCGANIAAAVGYQKQGGGFPKVLVIVLVVLGSVSCLGILAAIAIPNFLRYQLRAKQSEVPILLTELARAEQARASATGKYLPIPGIPAGQPGTRKAPFTAADKQIANEVAWTVEPAAYGRYHVAVAERDGVQAASLCGEQDLDEDGRRARFVVFLPAEGLEPPPAPCSEPVPWSSQYQAGEVVRVSEDSIF